MPAPPNPLSRHLVDRHEALFPKLEALARELEALARTKPGRAVPEDKRVAAEAMLCEAQRFRPGRGRGLVGAAPHCAGLAAQLAEALAALVAFEGRHTQWDSRVRALVWRFAPHQVVPVRRFAPRKGSRAAARLEMDIAAIRMARAVYMREIRAKLVKRLSEYKARDPALQNPAALARLAPKPPPPDPGPRIRGV